jgi:predicted nuclease of predicted toxin-antitoxin system
MKILIDENLSWRLRKSLAPYFEDVFHLSDLGLLEESDQNIWNWAKNSGFSVLTKDSDFYFLSLVNGCPPKVIRLNCRNLSTLELIQKILSNIDLIIGFLELGEDCYMEIN